MATFNEKPEYIRESVGSILNQTCDNFELIILDDSTSDVTKKEIDSLTSQDSRIVLVRKPQRMGFVPALNEGLRIAKGEYIARMDGDDISYPNRFELQLNYFNAHPEVDILGGAMDIMNEAGVITSHRHYPLEGKNLKTYAVYRNPLAHPTIMIKRNKFKEIKYDPDFKRSEDLELWLRLRNQGALIQNLSESLLKYRIISQMATKRDSLNFKYNLKARKRNFKIKSAIYDIPSILIAYLYSILPNAIINRMYNKENHTLNKK